MSGEYARATADVTLESLALQVAELRAEVSMVRASLRQLLTIAAQIAQAVAPEENR